MTIAAAFRFDGGIMLCADSEEATAQTKVSVPKIEVVDKKQTRLILTGAGDADMLNRAFEEIEHKVGARFSHATIRSTIEAIVSGLNQNYVYSDPAEEKPYFDLLVAYHTAKGSDFVKVSRRATVRPKHYELIGMGQLHGSHLMDRFYRPSITEQEAILLAVYLLQQTKRYVPYCGGESRIYMLRPTGQIDSITQERIGMDEKYAEAFTRMMHAPFFACVPGFTTSDEFEALLGFVVQGLAQMRTANLARSTVGITKELGPIPYGRNGATPKISSQHQGDSNESEAPPKAGKPTRRSSMRARRVRPALRA